MISQISAIALLAASAFAAPLSASSQYTSPQPTANQSAPPQPASPQSASPWSPPPPSTAPSSALSWFAPPWVTSHPPWQGGCGKEHISGYIDTPLTILSGGHVRTFTIQIPPKYDPHRSYPLILDFGKPLLLAQYYSSVAQANRSRSMLLPVRYCPVLDARMTQSSTQPEQIQRLKNTSLTSLSSTGVEAPPQPNATTHNTTTTPNPQTT